ncbi:MAG: DUF1273 domain-containing protein [Ruminococcaceae bacterium]|nr:DUF1273 domain-containing protein [Oscillospiraceae bacterium]
MKKCSFTGHRIIPEKHKEKLEALVFRAIEYAYSNECREFYTGGALGFDTMAAKAILKFRMKHSDVRLVIAVPCKDQAGKWSYSDRDMYDYILSSADEIIFCSEEYTKDCMKKRNEYLAGVCDMLIAYVGRSSSGAAQTVRMAKSFGKEVYNLYPTVADTAL